MAPDDAAMARRRTIVKTLLFIEAALLVALALWLIVLTLLDSSTELAPLLGEVSFALLGALGLFASGRAFEQGKSYGRAPAILANLIALGVARYQIEGNFWIGATIIISLALPTLYFTFRISAEKK